MALCTDRSRSAQAQRRAHQALTTYVIELEYRYDSYDRCEQRYQCQIGESLIVEAAAPMMPAWSPELFAATVELRRLLWPFTQQNPADAEALGLGPRFEPRGKPFGDRGDS
jgi:hypothetical protein